MPTLRRRGRPYSALPSAIFLFPARLCHRERGSRSLNAEIIVHAPELVPEAALEAVTARVGCLGVGVLHTLIGPPMVEAALSTALRRGDLAIVVGADHALITRLSAWLGVHMRPSRRAATYIAAACQAMEHPLNEATQALALMPAGSTVMGCPRSLDLGCGLTLGGRGLIFLPANPAGDLLSGDFKAFIEGLLISDEVSAALPPAVEAPPADTDREESPSSADVSTGATSDKKRLKRPVWRMLCALLALGLFAYPRLSAGWPGGLSKPVDTYTPEPVPLKAHHYQYLQQDVYEALYPDSGADQLSFLDALLGANTVTDVPGPAPEPEPAVSSALPASSVVPPASSDVPPASSDVPPASSDVPPASSDVPPTSSDVSVSSSAPPAVSAEPPPASSEPEPAHTEEPNPPNADSNALPPATSSWNETLYVTVNGSTIALDAYELVCQIVQVEMGGSLDHEALKAQAVAAYTYIKYNNNRGLYPSVGRNTQVNAKVRAAVSEVTGRAVYYGGDYINAVYHSTSRGTTTSARAVWGGDIPYLTPVDSSWDSASPYYSTRYTISADSFRQKVLSTYGIDLSGDPANWIEIDTSAMADGGYVGRVYIGGSATSQGGRVSAGTAITGRNVREVLLSFALRSHSFDVHYDGQNFVFSCYGYGHGVGLSQYGAHFMARQGYNYVEILEHYYSGAAVW